MPFDVAAARENGVSDDAILQHLTTTRKFDVEGAIQKGASKAQIIDYLAKTPSPNAAPVKSVSERARANQDPASPGNVQSNRIIAEAAQDEKNLYGRFAKDAALAVAAGAAAPFTGGASVLGALAIAGGAGAAGSLAGTGIQKYIGSNETPRSVGDLASVVGFDAASFVAGEGAGRLVGVVGKKLLPKFIIQTAGQVENGKKVLLQMYGATSRQLDAVIDSAAAAAGKPNGWTVGVDTVLKDLDSSLKNLPNMKNAFGRRFGGLTEKASETVSNIAETLATAGGNVVDQDLKGVIATYHSLQKMAFLDKSLSAREKDVFRKAAVDLGNVVKKAVKQVGPEAESLFKEANFVAKADMARDAALDLTTVGLKMLVKKAGLPLGATAIGYATAGAPGAAVGAGLSLGLPHVATFVLKQTLKHPQAAPLMKKAVDIAIEGHGKEAETIATKAMQMAGARAIISDLKDMISPPEQAEPAPLP